MGSSWRSRRRRKLRPEFSEFQMKKAAKRKAEERHKIDKFNFVAFLRRSFRHRLGLFSRKMSDGVCVTKTRMKESIKWKIGANKCWIASIQMNKHHKSNETYNLNWSKSSWFRIIKITWKKYQITQICISSWCGKYRPEISWRWNWDFFWTKKRPEVTN